MNFVAWERGVERLQVNLRASFRRAHHTAWVDRFVGGDEDEAFDAMLDCHFSHEGGSEHIVPDRLGRLVLQHGHVLVRSRVEDRLRPEPIEDRPHARGNGVVSDKRHDRSAIARCEEFLLDCKKMRLRAFDEEQRGGLERKNLPAELAADAATGARNHNGAGREYIAQRIRFHPDRGAAQQILNPDGPQSADAYTTRGELA
jgi:hypothetical protein